MISMWKTVLYLVLIGSITLVSCTSYKAMGPLENIQTKLQLGDKVRVITKDDRELRFTITAITSEALVGDDLQVLFNNIARLEKQGIHGGKTARAVANTVAVAASIVFLVAVVSFSR